MMVVDRRFYNESHETVRLSAYRIKQSPFAHRYTTDATVFGSYCDRLFPVKATLDEDPLPNYRKLRNGVLMYDVPEQPLAINGADAGKLLERVLTCRVENLAVGRCRYGIACNYDGTVLMDGVVMRLATDCYWYVKANGEFTSWLRAHAAGLDVEVTDPASRVLQIQGPKSLDVLNAAIDGTLSDDFKYFRADFFDIGGQTLWVSRTGWTGEVGIEIYCNSGPEPTDHDALWDHLLNAGEEFGMEFSSGLSMGIRRVEAGILDNGTDIEADLTPYSAGLGQFVNQGKDDFVGRAALEHAARNRLLLGLQCRDISPQSGMQVRLEGGPVGHITMGTWSPTLRLGIGYVRFHHPHLGGSWLGRTVSLQDRDGTEHEATVVSLPFIDRKKLLPRVPWTG